MFTGMIEAVGRVLRVERQGGAMRLAMEVPPGLTDMNLGDSISVNGACLTVVEIRGQKVVVDVSSETLTHTTLSEMNVGEAVNLERPLRLSDRLGGHLVTGHVDGVGILIEKQKEGEFFRTRIRIPGNLAKYLIEKGSIAIDGVSLTLNEYRGDELQLTLIPLTLQKTTLLGKKRGDRVNVEIDLFAKYIERFLDRKKFDEGSLSRDFLARHGFIKE